MKRPSRSTILAIGIIILILTAGTTWYFLRFRQNSQSSRKPDSSATSESLLKKIGRVGVPSDVDLDQFAASLSSGENLKYLANLFGDYQKLNQELIASKIPAKDLSTPLTQEESQLILNQYAAREAFANAAEGKVDKNVLNGVLSKFDADLLANANPNRNLSSETPPETPKPIEQTNSTVDLNKFQESLNSDESLKNLANLFGDYQKKNQELIDSEVPAKDPKTPLSPGESQLVQSQFAAREAFAAAAEGIVDKNVLNGVLSKLDADLLVNANQSRISTAEPKPAEAAPAEQITQPPPGENQPPLAATPEGATPASFKQPPAESEQQGGDAGTPTADDQNVGSQSLLGSIAKKITTGIENIAEYFGYQKPPTDEDIQRMTGAGEPKPTIPTGENANNNLLDNTLIPPDKMSPEQQDRWNSAKAELKSLDDLVTGDAPPWSVESQANKVQQAVSVLGDLVAPENRKKVYDYADRAVSNTESLKNDILERTSQSTESNPDLGTRTAANFTGETANDAGPVETVGETGSGTSQPTASPQTTDDFRKPYVDYSDSSHSLVIPKSAGLPAERIADLPDGFEMDQEGNIRIPDNLYKINLDGTLQILYTRPPEEEIKDPVGFPAGTTINKDGSITIAAGAYRDPGPTAGSAAPEFENSRVIEGTGPSTYSSYKAKILSNQVGIESDDAIKNLLQETEGDKPKTKDKIQKLDNDSEALKRENEIGSQVVDVDNKLNELDQRFGNLDPNDPNNAAEISDLNQQMKDLVLQRYDLLSQFNASWNNRELTNYYDRINLLQNNLDRENNPPPSPDDPRRSNFENYVSKTQEKIDTLEHNKLATQRYNDLDEITELEHVNTVLDPSNPDDAKRIEKNNKEIERLKGEVDDLENQMTRYESYMVPKQQGSELASATPEETGQEQAPPSAPLSMTASTEETPSGTAPAVTPEQSSWLQSVGEKADEVWKTIAGEGGPKQSQTETPTEEKGLFQRMGDTIADLWDGTKETFTKLTPGSNEQAAAPAAPEPVASGQGPETVAKTTPAAVPPVTTPPAEPEATKTSPDVTSTQTSPNQPPPALGGGDRTDGLTINTVFPLEIFDWEKSVNKLVGSLFPSDLQLKKPSDTGSPQPPADIRNNSIQEQPTPGPAETPAPYGQYLDGNGTGEKPFEFKNADESAYSIIRRIFEVDPNTGDVKLKQGWEKDPGLKGTVGCFKFPKNQVVDAFQESGRVRSADLDKFEKDDNITLPDGAKTQAGNQTKTAEANPKNLNETSNKVNSDEILICK
jgi:hypothetical protein